MSADENIKKIQLLYEAFGHGDVDAIVASVTDDVDWAAEAAGTGAPWYGLRSGPKGVAAFFADFGSRMEVETFEPLSFAGNENEVFALVRFAGRSRSTGRRVATDLHHFFRFKDGKISYYRGTEDTAQTGAALQS